MQPNTDLEIRKTHILRKDTFDFHSLFSDFSKLQNIAERLVGYKNEDRESELLRLDPNLKKEQKILIKVVLNAYDSWKHNTSYGKQETIAELFELFTSPTGRTSVLFSKHNEIITVSGSCLFILDSNCYPQDGIDWQSVESQFPKSDTKPWVRGCRIFHLKNPGDDITIDATASLLNASFDDAAKQLNVRPEDLTVITKLNIRNPLIIKYLKSRELIQEFGHPEFSGGDYIVYRLLPPKNPLNSLRITPIPDWMELLKLDFYPGNRYLLIGPTKELNALSSAFCTLYSEMNVYVNYTDAKPTKYLAPNEISVANLDDIKEPHIFAHVAFIGKSDDILEKLEKISSFIQLMGNLTLVLDKRDNLDLLVLQKNNFRLLSSSQYSEKSVFLFQKVEQGQPVRIEVVPREEPIFFKATRYLSRDGDIAEVVTPKEETILTIDVLPVARIHGILYVASQLGVLRVPPMLAENSHSEHSIGYFLNQQISDVQMMPKEFKVKYVMNRLGARSRHIRPIISKILQEKAGIASPFKVLDHFKYMTMIGYSAEGVLAFLVELDESTASRSDIKWIPADSHLALSHKTPGGMSDARSELMAYRLIPKGMNPGKWLGNPVKLRKRPIDIIPSNIGAFRAASNSNEFDLIHPLPAENINIHSVNAIGYDSNGREVTRHVVDCIDARNTKKSQDLSHELISVLPVCQTQYGNVLVGLEKKHFPSLQLTGFGSGTFSVPTFRLKVNEGLTIPGIIERFNNEFAVEEERILQCVKLGDFYYTSAGLTPDRLGTFCIEMDPDKSDKLVWFDVKELIGHHSEYMMSGQTLVSVFRLAHACGLFIKK